MDFKSLQLQTIELRSRPLGKRAIAWSADAELAVAADDSVCVFVPHFPRFELDHHQASQGGSEDAAPGDGAAAGPQGPVPLKPQFSDGQRRIPISLPRVNPRVNRHLWHAAGLESPYDPYDSDASDAAGSGAEDGGGGEGDGDDQDTEMSDGDGSSSRRRTARDLKRRRLDQEKQLRQQQYRRKVGDTRDPNNPFRVVGAGSAGGLFSSVGATLNHVVSLAWSPPVGRNGRCALAVHSAAGYVAVYGEPLVHDRAGRHHHRLGDRYDTEGWEVLWGVGERLAVPPQRSWGEAVRSFAWSRELWPGRALLALQTDVYEVLVLAVRTRAPATGEREEEEHVSDGDDWARGDLAAGWRVEEVARFDARGPHPAGSIRDPDYVPYKTGLGLAFGPCLTTAGGEAKECVIGFLARNYVGFRKITIGKDWFDNGDKFVKVADADVLGECLFLSTDAFLTFEDAIWDIDDQKVCRAVVATPFTPKTLQVKISATPTPLDAHPLTKCGTTYPSAAERSKNPIQDLIIHSPSLLKPTEAPIYTLIRMSAVQECPEWYYTNAELADYSPNGSNPRPKWAADIARRLEISMPKQMLARAGVKALGLEGDDDDDNDGGNDDDDDEDDEDEEDELDDNGEDAQHPVVGNEEQNSDANDSDNEEGKASTAVRRPLPSSKPEKQAEGEAIDPGANERTPTAAVATVSARQPGALRQIDTSDNVHIWRARLFGIALSPGGGCSAAVWAKAAAAVTERGAWHQARSTISFDSRPPKPGGDDDGGDGGDDGRLGSLSTEARVFEWMYGRGPGVPGLTGPPARGDADAAADEDENPRAEMKEIFRGLVASVKCPYCQGALVRDGLYFVCPRKHTFDACALTGYPVLDHGTSRVCGVCGVRRLKTDAIVRILPDKESKIRGIGSHVSRCVRCGGKYVD